MHKTGLRKAMIVYTFKCNYILHSANFLKYIKHILWWTYCRKHNCPRLPRQQALHSGAIVVSSLLLCRTHTSGLDQLTTDFSLYWCPALVSDQWTFASSLSPFPMPCSCPLLAPPYCLFLPACIDVIKKKVSENLFAKEVKWKSSECIWKIFMFDIANVNISRVHEVKVFAWNWYLNLSTYYTRCVLVFNVIYNTFM